MTLSTYDDVEEACPLITPFTWELGLPDELMEKLYKLRNWKIPDDGPVPFKWPTRLRTTLWDIIRERSTDIVLEPKKYQLKMAQTMSRIPASSTTMTTMS